MAFPVVETTQETAISTASTTHQYTLPTGIVAGNLILIVANKGNVNTTMNALTGWTELVSDTVANGNVIWYREADGTEGATVTFTSAASVRSAAILYRISGAEDPATQPPQLSTVATGTSANPNATTCTPTGGAKDYLWITMFGQAGEQADDDTLTSITPTGFTNPLRKTCGVAGTNLGGMVASAEQQLNAASVDATAWTSSDATAWRAYTIAVHPAPPQPQFDQVGFRGYADDAAMGSATPKANENANFSQLPNEKFRLRFVVDETTSVGSAQLFFQLQYNKNSAGWNDVNATSLVAQTVASDHVTNGTATARLLTSGTGTFHAGEFDSNNGLANGGTFAAGELTEDEYSLQLLGADVTGGDTIQFRVIRSVGGALDAYAQTPTVTVASAAATSLTPYRSPYPRILAG